MNIITFFLKKLKSILFRLAQTRVFIFVIANLAVFLLVELSEIIKIKLKALNDNFKVQLYALESFLFTKAEEIFSSFENVLTGFKGQVEGVVNTILADINLIFTIINYTAWFDLFVQTMVSSIKGSILALANTLVNPFFILIGNISGKLEDLERFYTRIEAMVNDKAQSIYETVNNELISLQTAYNNALATFFDGIEQGFDWYNDGVNTIEAGARAQIMEIEAHNTIIESIVIQIEAKIIQGIQAGGGPPLSQVQIDVIISDISELLDDIPDAVDMTALNIDYAQYRIELVQPDILDISSIEIPALDNFFDLVHQEITPLEACLVDVRSNLQTFKLDLEGLPDQAKEHFISQFPAILRSIVSDELEALLTLALTQVFMQLRTDISNLFGSIRGQIEANKTGIVESLQVKATEFIETMEQKEQELVENLNDLIKPSIERFIDAVVDEIEQANEKIAGEDIKPTDFIPDVESITRIMETLPATKPQTTPIKKDSKDLSIQDIYRILCNNFSRNERLALMFSLAPEDVQISTQELGDLMLDFDD